MPKRPKSATHWIDVREHLQQTMALRPVFRMETMESQGFLEFGLDSAHRNKFLPWTLVWLVVSTPLQNMTVSWAYYFQYMEQIMFQTTNQI